MSESAIGLFLDDVQILNPRHGWPISRVGIMGAKELVRIAAADGSFTTIGTFDIFVDLPSHLRGIHMSRSTEAVNEILWDTLYQRFRSPTGELMSHDMGELCAEIAHSVLEKHNYASIAEVHYRGDYFVSKQTPVTRRPVQEVYRMFCAAISARQPDGFATKIKLGVEVVGATVCPCAQNEYTKLVRDRVVGRMSEDELVTLLHDIALPSHMQRVICNLALEVPEEEYNIRVEDLITFVEQSVSTETYELLKREDELHLVERAFRNPRFVEDVVRLVVSHVMERYSIAHPSWKIDVSAISQESIHKHNAFAQISSTLTELGDVRSGNQGRDASEVASPK